VVKQVVTDRSSDAAHLVERRDSNQNLRNLGSTPDAETRRVSLKKTPNAILGPSGLPAMMAEPDKRLQTGPFCVGVV